MSMRAAAAIIRGVCHQLLLVIMAVATKTPHASILGICPRLAKGRGLFRFAAAYVLLARQNTSCNYGVAIHFVIMRCILISCSILDLGIAG